MASRSFVLVPVDGLRDTRSSVEFAVRIAKQRAADVRAVQVVPRAQGRLIEPPEDPTLRSTLRLLRRAAEREGVRVRHITLSGTPEQVIPAYAQLTEAEVIVVGRNYGTSTLWRNSSVVRRLSRSSSVPVIVVPRQYTATRAALSLTRVVAAVDFTVASAVALRTAIELATRHGARLTVLHAMGFPRHLAFSAGEVSRLVQDLPIEATRLGERLKQRAAAFGLRDVEPLVVTGEASSSIAEQAAAMTADLIVMGVAPRHWLDEVVFGSTLGAVLRKAKTPVLVLPVIAGAHEWSDNFKGEWPVRSGAAATAAPLAA